PRDAPGGRGRARHHPTPRPHPSPRGPPPPRPRPRPPAPPTPPHRPRRRPGPRGARLDQPLPGRRPAVQPAQGRGGPRLVDEHQPPDVQPRQRLGPLLPLLLHVGAVLLGGPAGFFFTVSFFRPRKRHRRAAPTA